MGGAEDRVERGRGRARRPAASRCISSRPSSVDRLLRLGDEVGERLLGLVCHSRRGEPRARNGRPRARRGPTTAGQRTTAPRCGKARPRDGISHARGRREHLHLDPERVARRGEVALEGARLAEQRPAAAPGGPGSPRATASPRARRPRRRAAASRSRTPRSRRARAPRTRCAPRGGTPRARAARRGSPKQNTRAGATRPPDGSSSASPASASNRPFADRPRDRAAQPPVGEPGEPLQRPLRADEHGERVDVEPVDRREPQLRHLDLERHASPLAPTAPGARRRSPAGPTRSCRARRSRRRRCSRNRTSSRARSPR